MNIKEKYAMFLDEKDTYYMNLILNLRAFVTGIMNWHNILGEQYKNIYIKSYKKRSYPGSMTHSWKFILRK